MGANDRLVALEVEDHPTPIKELHRLLGIRLSQVAVTEAHAALRDARNSDNDEARTLAIELARDNATRAVALYEYSDAGFIALAGAEAEAGNMAAASEAARRALLLNPVLKRYSVIPETGLGIEPPLLKRLLEEAAFKQVWDALPGDDEVDSAILNAEPAEAAE